MKIFHSINSLKDEVKYSFSTIASGFGYIAIWISAMLTYKSAIWKEHDYVKLLNKILKMEKEFGAFKDESGTTVYFVASAVMNILVNLFQLILILILVDDGKLNIFDHIIFHFPCVVNFVMGNLFILGTLSIRHLILHVRELSSNLEKFDINGNLDYVEVMEIERILTKISQGHAQVFEITSDFSKTFSNKIYFLFGGMFLRITSQCFFEFTSIFNPEFFKPGKMTITLQLIGGLLLLVDTMNVIFNVLMASNCSEEVSSKRIQIGYLWLTIMSLFNCSSRNSI